MDKNNLEICGQNSGKNAIFFKLGKLNQNIYFAKSPNFFLYFGQEKIILTFFIFNSP